MPRFRTLTIALVCALVALVVGLWLGGHSQLLPGPVRNVFVTKDQALRQELIDTIDQNFYRPVDNNRLQGSSLNGLVAGLDDRFSHYFTPQETARFQQSVSGEFDGVGMTVIENPQGLLVENVFQGSPADRAQIHTGDVVTAVDGQSIAGQASETATAKIQGPAGTKVTLTLAGQNGQPPRTVAATRQRIQIPVVSNSLVPYANKTIGVVRLMSFTSGAHAILRQNIDDLLHRGAQGIVLDLRGNGGGLLEESVGVASNFIDRGPVVSTKGRTQPPRVYNATGGAIDPRVPMAVLVDGGTASASEIVTGALQDYHRATVVGQRTFGKGVFQQVQPLSNGGALDLTVGSYFLPHGEPLPTNGIQPDVATPPPNPQPPGDQGLPPALQVVAGQIR